VPDSGYLASLRRLDVALLYQRIDFGLVHFDRDRQQSEPPTSTKASHTFGGFHRGTSVYRRSTHRECVGVSVAPRRS
jgi:hypothetical protein